MAFTYTRSQRVMKPSMAANVTSPSTIIPTINIALPSLDLLFADSSPLQ